MSFNGSFNSILNLNYKIIENNPFDEKKYTIAKTKIDNFIKDFSILDYTFILKYFQKEYLGFIIYDFVNFDYYDYYLKSDYYMRYNDKIEDDEINTEPEYISKMTTKEEFYTYLIIKMKDNPLIKEKYPNVYKDLKDNKYNTDDYDSIEILKKYNLKRIDNIVIRLGLKLIHSETKLTSIVTVNENKYFDLPQYEIEYFRRLINGCN